MYVHTNERANQRTYIHMHEQNVISRRTISACAAVCSIAQAKRPAAAIFVRTACAVGFPIRFCAVDFLQPFHLKFKYILSPIRMILFLS